MATSIVKTPQKVESESPPMTRFFSYFVYNYYKLWNILSSSYSGTYWSYDACFTPARTDQACIIDFGQLYLLTRLHILLVQFDIFLTQLYISVAHTDYFILNQPALPTCSRRGKNEVRYVLRIGTEGGRVFFIILYQSYEHFKYQTNRGRWNLFLICLQFLFLYLE